VVEGGSQICTGEEDCAGGRSVFPKLSEDLDIELSAFEAEDATLKSD
jgi:hypothetical protein